MPPGRPKGNKAKTKQRLNSLLGEICLKTNSQLGYELGVTKTYVAILLKELILAGEITCVTEKYKVLENIWSNRRIIRRIKKSGISESQVSS